MLIGDLGRAAEGTATWWRWEVQGGQFPGSLVDDQLRQLVRQVDLAGLKALAGELHADAMGDTEEFKAGLEHPIAIGGQRS
jgi:hypothetical protein